MYAANTSNILIGGDTSLKQKKVAWVATIIVLCLVDELYDKFLCSDVPDLPPSLSVASFVVSLPPKSPQNVLLLIVHCMLSTVQ